MHHNIQNGKSVLLHYGHAYEYIIQKVIDNWNVPSRTYSDFFVIFN